MQSVLILLGDRTPGFPIGTQNGLTATISYLDYGSGTNDPQLWLTGFDEATIGEHADVTVDSDGLTGWTSGSLLIGETLPEGTSNGFRTLDGKFVFTNKAKIVLFKAYSNRAPENGTYHLTISGGGIDANLTIIVAIP